MSGGLSKTKPAPHSTNTSLIFNKRDRQRDDKPRIDVSIMKADSTLSSSSPTRESPIARGKAISISKAPQTTEQKVFRQTNVIKVVSNNDEKTLKELMSKSNHTAQPVGYQGRTYFNLHNRLKMSQMSQMSGSIEDSRRNYNATQQPISSSRGNTLSPQVNFSTIDKKSSHLVTDCNFTQKRMSNYSVIQSRKETQPTLETDEKTTIDVAPQVIKIEEKDKNVNSQPQIKQATESVDKVENQRNTES